MRRRIRLVFYALCVVPALVLMSCSTSGGGCSGGGGPGVIIEPDKGLQLYGTADVFVGDEVRVNARYADSHGNQYPDFWKVYPYSITHSGLGYIDDVGLLNPDGTAYARYRALTTGTFYVQWTVYYADPQLPPNTPLDSATFTVTVR